MNRREMEAFLQMAEDAPAQDPADGFPSMSDLLRREVKNPQTLRALDSDMRDFYGRSATDAMLRWLVTLDEERLRLLLEEYRAYLFRRGLSVATMNRRFATLRRVFRVAKQNGLRGDDASQWLAPVLAGSGSPPPAPAEADQDKAVEEVLRAPDATSLLGSRDRGVLWIIGKIGLSRTQIVELSIGDFDREAGTLRVLPLRQPRHLDARLARMHQFRSLPPNLEQRRKSHLLAWDEATAGQPTYKIRLPAEVVQVLEEYLHHLERGGFDLDVESPLFRTFDSRHVKDSSKNQRLTEDGVYVIVRRHAKNAGYPAVNARVLQRAAQKAMQSAEQPSSEPSSA